jgi:hypothetical protein
MLNDETPIDLVTRLWTMSRVLDSLVPESPSALLEAAVEAAFEAVGRRELSKAMMLLEEGVQANPFWLRGYLLLATIYEHAQKSEPAIATIEQGLAMCASGLRLFGAQGWGETLERINGPVAHRRIRNHLERLRRYERMFRHRLVMLQIRCGSFDEAIAQWSAIEEEHCA